MAKSPTPITDLFEKLMSTQMSTVDILAAARTVEEAATNARASTPEDRKRWADQKKRQRGGGTEMSTGQGPAAIPSLDNNSNDSEKKEEVATNVHVDKRGSSKGTRIPENWQPSADDIVYGMNMKAKLTQDEVMNCAEEMKLWGLANANRAVARKADWSLTFKGWLRREAPKIIRSRPRGGGGGFNGQAATANGGTFAGLAARIRHGQVDNGPDRPSPEDLEPVNRR